MTPWGLGVQFSPVLFAEPLLRDGAMGGLEASALERAWFCSY